MAASSPARALPAAPAAVRVRALGPIDAVEYRALRLAGIAEMPAAFFTSHAAESALPLAVIQQRLLQTPYQRVFGAFDGARLVGITSFKREPIAVVHDRASIWGVYVAAEARRQGVARQLMLAAAQHARWFPELTHITLKVHQANAAAIALYASLGFAPGAALPHDETGMLLQL